MDGRVKPGHDGGGRRMAARPPNPSVIRWPILIVVMAGPVPSTSCKGCVRVDARDKPGHDDKSTRRSAPAGTTRTTVIVGFNPTIHAMTVQKHCPQNRPFATAARYGKLRVKSTGGSAASSWHGWPGQARP
jgi:hypothetical protein